MNLDIFNTLFANVWSIFLVILAFGGSIFVHELGHFLAARRRGLIVERFSIGFGPKIASWEKNGTEYCISLLPLGGYVALPQLADMGAIEGKSKRDLNQLPPISYADKIIVSVMGAVFNVIFAFVLATILWGVGQPSSKEQQTTTIGYVPTTINIDLNTEVPSPAHEAGLKPGDKIITVDGHSVRNFQDIQQYILMGSERNSEGSPRSTFKIERDGKIFDVNILPRLVQFNALSNDRMRITGISPEQTLLVGEVMKHSPAEDAGIKKGDLIQAVDGTPLHSLKSLSDYLAETKNESVMLALKRNDKTLNISVRSVKVPYTKPMGLLTAIDQSKDVQSLKLLPVYAKNVKENLTDPKLPSKLEVFEKPKIASLFNIIEPGDTLVAINDQPVQSLESFLDLIMQSKNQTTLKLDFQRNGSAYAETFNSKSVKPTILEPKTQPLIGIVLDPAPLIAHINPIIQFADNINMTFRTLASLLTRGSNLTVQNLMGPPGIIRVLHSFSTQDIRLLIWFVILLNINLAVLNLMPIPVLDGGHMLFATIAKLSGRSIPTRFIAATQGIFMILLFSLMIYISFFDVRRWQGDKQLEAQVKRQQELYIPTSFKQ